MYGSLVNLLVTKHLDKKEPYMHSIAEYWNHFQPNLFARIETALEDILTPKLQQLVRIFDFIRIEKYIPSSCMQGMGRPKKDRRAIARAFIVKAFYNYPTSKALVEALKTQPTLRRLCGFETMDSVPSEATFSRAFAAFARRKLLDAVHEALVKETVGELIVMHISRDSTAVIARERVHKKQKAPSKPKLRAGRPKKGEERPALEQTRLEKQIEQAAEEALAELPYYCNVGAKKDSKGNPHYWIGWKTHIDWADGGIPLHVVTTSASLHDSQVAIPMAKITATRCTSLYDLMDSAYDAEPIRKVSEELGHVPIIDPNCRRREAMPMESYRSERYKERSTAERGNSRLKDEFGLRHLRVRGHGKAHLHIMFGIIALFADQCYKVFAL